MVKRTQLDLFDSIITPCFWHSEPFAITDKFSRKEETISVITCLINTLRDSWLWILPIQTHIPWHTRALTHTHFFRMKTYHNSYAICPLTFLSFGTEPAVHTQQCAGLLHYHSSTKVRNDNKPSLHSLSVYQLQLRSLCLKERLGLIISIKNVKD